MLEREHGKQKMTQPHFVNLNEDPMLSGVIHHPILKGKVTLIGRKDADPSPDIVLTGLRWENGYLIAIWVSFKKYAISLPKWK